MTIEHNAIGAGEIHEPKGITAATVNEVYVADGASSGAWKNIYLQGWEDQQDTATTGTPISVPGTSTYVYMTNNGLGTYTEEGYILPGRTSAWNTTSNQFEWNTSGIVLGDTCDIRVDIYVTTTAANQTVDVDLEMGIGSGANYDLEFIHAQYKTAGVQHMVLPLSFYLGNTATLNFPAKLKIKSDAAATLVVNGWYLRTVPRNPIFL